MNDGIELINISASMQDNYLMHWYKFKNVFDSKTNVILNGVYCVITDLENTKVLAYKNETLDEIKKYLSTSYWLFKP